MKTVGTKLDNSEYEIFDYVCSENGLTKSEQLRDLIKTFCDDSEIDAESEPTQPKPTITIRDVDEPLEFDCEQGNLYVDGNFWI